VCEGEQLREWAISGTVTWCSLFYSTVPRLELMLAVGNSGHYNAQAAGHF